MIWTSVAGSSLLAKKGAITHFLPKLRNSEVIELDESHSEGDDLRGRSQVYADESPGTLALVIVLAVAALGALLGSRLILGAPQAERLMKALSVDDAPIQLWAGLIGVLCGYGLAALVVIIYWLCRVLKMFRRIPLWHAAGWVLAAFITITAVDLAGGVIPAGTVNGQPVRPFLYQIEVLTYAGAAAAIPGLIGFLALRSLARDDSQWDEQRDQILMVLLLRRYLRRLLGAFGLFLTLYVVVTANRRQLVLALYPNATFPPDYALLIGLIFAAVLAAFHVSTTLAINWRCDRLLDHYAPIPSPSAADISTPLKKRQDLATLLGADSSWQQTFQNGVFVLAPLLTALIGTALPK